MGNKFFFPFVLLLVTIQFALPFSIRDYYNTYEEEFYDNPTERPDDYPSTTERFTTEALTTASIKASTGASTQASTDASIKASTEASNKASIKASTEASIKASIKASTEASSNASIKWSTEASTKASITASTEASTTDSDSVSDSVSDSHSDPDFDTKLGDYKLLPDWQRPTSEVPAPPIPTRELSHPKFSSNLQKQPLQFASAGFFKDLSNYLGTVTMPYR